MLICFRETPNHFHVTMNFLRDLPRNLRLQNELPLIMVLAAINLLEYISLYTNIRANN